ncbi:uncharacterized protein PAC_09706 [Phialocephala subalpina]|uniref:Myb-like DNA-binding domain-containing protein n=1 Tax=Phialocephala subalpina TaxID=576137 RepID=A0A1L7X487_9HELO|nr:uncharacterized protein PAC_09706 [Phialocephala subalpina]
MPEGVTFSAADQALCLGVLKQIEVGKVDYELLRIELGLPTKNAAQVRWSRFNSKLKKGVASSPAKTIKMSNQQPSTPTSKPKRKNNTSTKKRKVDTSDEEEQDGIKSLAAMDIKNEGDGGDSGLMEPFQTPTRQLPSRRARVTNFKELAFDGEEEEEEKEMDEFEDSGVGSTAKEEFEMASVSDDEV